MGGDERLMDHAVADPRMRIERHVFVTGGTGYIGRQLIPLLTSRGHLVRALARPGAEVRLPHGSIAITGNALDGRTYSKFISPADTFVHLVGVTHPGPSKAEQFRNVDRTSTIAAIEAAGGAGISHFVYLSVAHPAPVMKAYINVRMECETLLRSSGLNVTILRPWYVLGPGHRWPYLLLPVYWVFEMIPFTRERALRLGLVTITRMVDALAWAVENPCLPEGSERCVRLLDVPGIRALRLASR